MKTKLGFLYFLLILLTAGLLVTTACDKNSSDPKDDEETLTLTDAEIQEDAEAAYDAALYAEAMAMPTSALAASVSPSKAALGKNASTADTLFNGCPIAIYNRIKRELLIDYGSGCTGISGVTHSGSILLKGKAEDGKLYFYATFNDFTSNEYKLSGDVRMRIGIDSIYIDITDGVLSNNDTLRYLNGYIRMAIDMNNTLQNPFDDVYKVDIALVNYKVVGEKEITHNISVFTSPGALLEFRLLCEYPYRGILNIARVGKPSLTMDFEPYNGGCDDIVKIKTDGMPEGTVVSLSDLF